MSTDVANEPTVAARLRAQLAESQEKWQRGEEPAADVAVGFHGLRTLLEAADEMFAALELSPCGCAGAFICSRCLGLAYGKKLGLGGDDGQ